MTIRSSVLVSGILTAIALISCKPAASGSEVQSIVGRGDDGRLRSLTLVALKNRSVQELQSLDPLKNADSNEKRFRTMAQIPFFAFVECRSDGNDTAAAVEAKVRDIEALSLGSNLYVDDDRSLVAVYGEKTANLNEFCNIVGSRFVSWKMARDFFGRTEKFPRSVPTKAAALEEVRKTFLVAQSLFASMRGNGVSNKMGRPAPLFIRLLDIAKADELPGSHNLKATADAIMDGEDLFNPCARESNVWFAKKFRNSALDCTPDGKAISVRSGVQYSTIRDTLVDEVALTFNELYPRSDSQLYKLWDILSSTKPWNKQTADGRSLIVKWLTSKSGLSPWEGESARSDSRLPQNPAALIAPANEARTDGGMSGFGLTDTAVLANPNYAHYTGYAKTSPSATSNSKIQYGVTDTRAVNPNNGQVETIGRTFTLPDARDGVPNTLKFRTDPYGRVLDPKALVQQLNAFENANGNRVETVKDANGKVVNTVPLAGFVDRIGQNAYQTDQHFNAFVKSEIAGFNKLDASGVQLTPQQADIRQFMRTCSGLQLTQDGSCDAPSPVVPDNAWAVSEMNNPETVPQIEMPAPITAVEPVDEVPTPTVGTDATVAPVVVPADATIE